MSKKRKPMGYWKSEENVILEAKKFMRKKN
jgi:hypothetical protein